MNIEDAVSKIRADGATINYTASNSSEKFDVHFHGSMGGMRKCVGATGKTLNEAASKAANKFISIKRLGGEAEL